MKNHRCEACGNDTVFYNNVAVEAKLVFNQKTGKEYVLDKKDRLVDVESPVVCYKCDEVVSRTRRYWNYEKRDERIWGEEK